MKKEIGGVSVEWIRKKVKRVTLRVGIGGSVTVTLPRTYSEQKAVAFVESKRDWLLAQVKKKSALPAFDQPKNGELFRLLGRLYAVKTLQAKTPAFAVCDGELVCRLTADEKKNERAFTAWKKSLLAPILQRYLDKWSKQWELSYGRVRMQAMRSRWGSCNVKTKNLCFNLRLLAQDESAIEAVVAHELCHILHTRHDAAFYAPLLAAMPDYKQRIRRLVML